MATIFEVLTFHKADRRMFETILRLGCTVGLARNIIAFWLCMIPMGLDVIQYLGKITKREVVLVFVKEAEAILDVLRLDSPPPAGRQSAIPYTASLLEETFDLGFIYTNRNAVVQGIIRALEGVCPLIFDGHLNPLMNLYEAEKSSALHHGRTAPPMPEDLATAYHPPRPGAVPEDYRSMFVTFSRGNVFAREEIADYFNVKWENSVERVMMEKRTAAEMPEYGRIIFKREGFVDLMLNGQEMVDFSINGKQLRGRKYVPRDE